MTSFKITYKRNRPLLGTFLEIKLVGDSTLDTVLINHELTQVFEKASQLQSIFNIFDTNSEICRFNQSLLGDRIQVSKTFFDLLQLARQIEQLSENSFNCFSSNITKSYPKPFQLFKFSDIFWIEKLTTDKLDLNGIAKGFIVDQVATDLIKRFPLCAGSVNAGGDLRFFNEPKRKIQLRLGVPDLPLWQNLTSPFDGIASSSLSETTTNKHSKTRYFENVRAPLDNFSTVTVMGPSCAIADSLTKVALFASTEIIKKCADHFKNYILIFDRHGTLIESFGGV